MSQTHLAKLVNASLGGSNHKLRRHTLLLPAISSQADDCGAKERKTLQRNHPTTGL